VLKSIRRQKWRIWLTRLVNWYIKYSKLDWVHQTAVLCTKCKEAVTSTDKINILDLRRPITTAEQVLLKVIWEECVAHRRKKRVANYWDRTALACCRHSKRVELSEIRLDSATRRMRPYAGVCCTAAKCLSVIAIHYTGVSPSCACFVTFLHLDFSSTPNLILNLTTS